MNNQVTNIQVNNVARFDSVESRQSSTVDVMDQEEKGVQREEKYSTCECRIVVHEVHFNLGTLYVNVLLYQYHSLQHTFV